MKADGVSVATAQGYRVVDSQRSERGLAITRLKGGSSVTHLASGAAVRGAECFGLTDAEAGRWMDVLLAMNVDWTQPAEALQATPRLMLRVSQAWAEFDLDEDDGREDGAA